MEAEDLVAATARADSRQRVDGGDPAASQVRQYTSLEWRDLDKSRFLVLNPSVFALIRLLQHPAAVIKTRYQLQQQNRLYSSPATVFSQTLRNEGLRGLYRGFGTSALMLLVQQAYIVMYEYLRASDRYEGVGASLRAAGDGGSIPDGMGGMAAAGGVPSPGGLAPVAAPLLSESTRNAIAAAVSVLTVQVLANPIDVVSQRLMMQGQRVSNAPQMAPEPPSTGSMVGPVAAGTAATPPPPPTLLTTTSAASSTSAATSAGAAAPPPPSAAAIAVQSAAGPSPATLSALRPASAASGPPTSALAPAQAGAGGGATGTPATPALARPQIASGAPASHAPSMASLPDGGPAATSATPAAPVRRGNRIVSGGGSGAQAGAAADIVKQATAHRVPPPAPIPRVLTAMEIAGQVVRAGGLRGLYSGFGISCLQFIPSASLWWFVYPIYRDSILPYLQPRMAPAAASRPTSLEPAAARAPAPPPTSVGETPSATSTGGGAGGWSEFVRRLRAMSPIAAASSRAPHDDAPATAAAASSMPLSSLTSWIPPARIAEVVAGGAASMTVSIALNPLDIVRTRTQVEGQAAVAVARALIATEGLRGLWKGTTARMAMLIPQGALTIAAYEFVKRMSALPPEQRHQQRVDGAAALR